MYRSNRVVVEAPAKINLHLDITGAAENGYHLLETVMQAVDLSDCVTVGRSTAPGIRVTCSRPGVPEDAGNLAHKAATAFLAAAGLAVTGLSIHIHKAIPHEAGLGGGSADAAAVLVGLNDLLGAGLSLGQLCELGLTLGADVPFAIVGGCQLAAGVGELLSPLAPGLPPCWLVIAKPEAGMSTARAYGLYDSAPPPRHPLDSMEQSLAAGDLMAVAAQLYNVFELVADDGGHTAALKAAMAAHGALGAILSGSGSAVVGVFRERGPAEACVAGLGMLARESFLARPVPCGAKIIHRS